MTTVEMVAMLRAVHWEMVDYEGEILEGIDTTDCHDIAQRLEELESERDRLSLVIRCIRGILDTPPGGRFFRIEQALEGIEQGR